MCLFRVVHCNFCLVFAIGGALPPLSLKIGFWGVPARRRAGGLSCKSTEPLRVSALRASIPNASLVAADAALLLKGAAPRRTSSGSTEKTEAVRCTLPLLWRCMGRHHHGAQALDFGGKRRCDASAIRVSRSARRMSDHSFNDGREYRRTARSLVARSALTSTYSTSVG